MIPLDKITLDTIEERYDLLPDNLAEALDDPKNREIINLISKDHHITDEEKIATIQQLVGLVILGFIHTYDLGKEINEALALNNPQLAQDIASAINNKVFGPIKFDLDKNYRPIMEEIGETLPVEMPLASDKKETAPEETAKEEIKEVLPVELPLASAQKESAPAETAKKEAEPPSAESYSEAKPFDSLQDKPIPVNLEDITSTPKEEELKAAFKTELPTPVFLHKESEFKPLKEIGKISLEKIGGSSAFAQVSETKEKMAAPSAQIEIGLKKEEKAPLIAKSEAKAPRIVHYSQFRTPLQEIGIPTESQKPEAASEKKADQAAMPLSSTPEIKQDKASRDEEPAISQIKKPTISEIKPPTSQEPKPQAKAGEPVPARVPQTPPPISPRQEIIADIKPSFLSEPGKPETEIKPQQPPNPPEIKKPDLPQPPGAQEKMIDLNSL